jgi:hypothetical protein
MESTRRVVAVCDLDYNLIIRCADCYDQFHFNCLYPKVKKDKFAPFLPYWRCEKCFKYPVVT